MTDTADPPERDTKDYKFQQLCKVRINSRPDSLPLERGSGIEVSSKYGLTFVATQDGFKVLSTHEFITQDRKHSMDRLQHVITDFPVLTEVTLGEKVTHLSLSCDDLTLAVATVSATHLFAYMYDVRSFAGQVTASVSAFLKVNLSDSSNRLLALAWNPVSAKLLVTCLSSGRLDMYEITDNLGTRATADNAKARCVCWSPKGKQLVVGREDGLLVQYDPDLNIKRKWDYPTAFADQSYQAIDMMWLSTFSFMVAYISSGADCSDQPTLLLVSGSKDQPALYTDFEDVCFGRGEERQRQYFFNFVQKWDMLVSASSNGSEVGIIGKHLDNKETLERWNLDDSARAECPLTVEYDDTYPLGVAIDFSSETAIPLGDEKIHPPSPLMLVLSSEGLIIPYYMMYLHKDAPAITEPVQPLDTAGIRRPVGIQAPPPETKQSSTVKNLFGTTSDSVPQRTAQKSLFGADQSTPKPLFGGGQTTTDQTELKTALGGTDQSGVKPTFGSGQPFSFTSSTPKSGSAGAFSFTPSVGAPAATTTTGFTFGQNAATGPSFSFLAKPAAAGTTVSDAVGMSSTSGPTLGTKFGEPAAQASSFQFKVGVPVSNQPAGQTQQTVATTAPPAFGTANNTPAFGTSMAPPAFGTATAPAFGTATAPPAFGTTTAPAFGTATAPPAFGTSTAPPAFGTSTAPPAFGTSTAPPTFGTATAPQAFGTATAPPAYGTATAPPAFGTATTAPAFGTKANAPPASGIATAPPAFGTATAPPAFGASTGMTFPAASTGLSNIGSSKGFGSPAPSTIGTFGAANSALTSAVNLASVSTGSPTVAPPTYKPPAVAPPTYKPPAVAPPTTKPAFVPTTKPATQVSTTPASTGGTSSGEAAVTEGAEASSQAVDSTFSKSILEEIRHFNQELCDLKSRAVKTDVIIGSRDEMKTMKKQTEDMNLYCGEMKKTMKELNEDVQDQRAFCLDMFASVEESRMRQQMMTDPKYQHLLKSRPLDPGSAEKLLQLQQQYQVLDQGLRDVDLILDTQWEEYQNRKKNRTNRIQAPTNDAVYRVVKSNHNIIVAQKAKLSELEERLKQLKLYNQTVSWNSSAYSTGESTELSTLADSLVSSSPIKRQTRSQENVKSDNSNKMARLRDHLYRRHVPVIKSTRPDNLSMSRLAVEDRELLRSLDKIQAGSRPPVNTVGIATAQSQGQPGTYQRGTPDRSATKPGSNQVFQTGGSKPGTQAPVGQGTGIAGHKSRGQSQAVPTSTGLASQLAAQVKQTGFAQMAANLGSQSKTVQFPSVPGGMGLSMGDSRGQQGFGNMTGLQQQQQLPPEQQKQPVTLRVKEINGMKLEDITPSGSENEVEETEEDEYSDDEEDDSSGSNGQGFGLQYNMQATIPAGIDPATPVSSKPGIKTLDGTQPNEVGTPPVGRKLFGSDNDQSTGTFNLNTGSTTAPKFSFGSSSGSVSKNQSEDGQTSAKTFSFGQPGATTASTGQFTFGQPSAESAGQFSFGQSVSSGPSSGQSTGFTFGQAGAAGPSITSSSIDGGTSGFKLGAQTTAAVGIGGTTSGIPQTTLASFTQPQNTILKSALAQPATPPVTISSLTRPSPSSSIFGQPSDADSSVDAPVVAPSVVARSTRDEAGTRLGGGVSQTGSVVQETSNSESTAASDQPKPGTGLSSSIHTSPASNNLTAQEADSTTVPEQLGQASAPVSGGLFGKTGTTPVVGSSLFGFAASSASPAPFGSSTTSSASSALFGLKTGTPASTTTAPSGLFGSTASSASPAASEILGQPSSSAATSSKSDTPASTTTTSSGSLIGGLLGQSSSNEATSGTGLFGKPTSTVASTTPTPFGQPSSTGTSAGSGLFGQTTTASSLVTSPFGQPASTTSTPGAGLFGQPASTAQPTSNGSFGQTASTASSSGAGPFGQPSGSLFGSGGGTSLFGSSAATTSAGAFGQTSTGGALFGSGGSGFSTATTSSGFGTATSGSGFGFGQTASTGFGSPGFGQGQGFGQTSEPGSGFGVTSGDGSGMFGGLGGKPSEEKANTNVFGKAQTFGTVGGTSTVLFGAQTQTPAFGGNSTAPTSGSPFSASGAFSSGGQGVGSTGFSGLGQQGQGGGFGGSPSFGSSPSFGTAQAFGSAPKFGNSPTFGAGSTGFGSGPAFGGGTAFGSPSTSGAQSGGFAGFAGATSPTFGALAQSTDAPTFGSFGQGGGGGGEGTFGGAGAGGGGFGNPGFGGGQSPGFGGSSFGSSPSFTGYRG